jgi:type III secretion protein F
MANNVDTVLGNLQTTPGTGTPAFPIQTYNTVDGFDLIWSQKFLQDSMTKVENDISQIQQNANLSDTEKMFSMQMAMNTWSAISNLRTNILKSVSDTLKSIARNVA